MSVSSGEGSQARPLDALPKMFVDSMRILFDIMDDKRTGYVHYSDIEDRWQEEEGNNVPKGVLECLRKVTPSNGLLSFERFVAGLKICLLRNRAEAMAAWQQQQTPPPPPQRQQHHQQQQQQQQQQSHHQPQHQQQQQQHHHHHHQQQQQAQNEQQRRQMRPPSAPTLDPAGTAPPPAARPHSVIGQQRTLSMPQLGGDEPLPAPPKPPRAVPPAAALSRTQILTALQRWHKERVERGRGDGKDMLPPPDAVSSSEAELGGAAAGAAPVPAKKTAQRKREPRRHTLQNGIDYNMLKRMKQIEHERDTLQQGLQMVERARDWYHKQVAAVNDRMEYLGLGRAPPQSEHTTDANEERLSFQTARIHEVNQHLHALIDSSRRGFPVHMNLALGPCLGAGASAAAATSPTTERTVRRLRAQNAQLTDEVAQRSERITALEREKTSVIRELFNARSDARRSHHPDETTLI